MARPFRVPRAPRVLILIAIGLVAVALASWWAYVSRPLSPNELRQLSLEALQSHSERGADRVAALCVLGERLHVSGQVELAAGAYATARQLDPTSVVALAGWIACKVGPSAPCQAEAALRELAQAQPNSPAPQFALAELYLSVDDLPHAEPFLQEAVRLLPDDSQVCFRYGSWLALRGLRGKAIDQLAKAASLAPKVPEYRIALLDLLVLQGRHDEAAAHLRVARTLVEDSASLEYYQAKLLLAKQEDKASVSRADECLRRAVELAPQWLAPRMLIASQAMSRGKPGEAIAQLESARSLGIHDTPSLVALAQAYHRAGRSKEGLEAQRAYERAQREARSMNDLLNAAIAAPKDVGAKLRLARALRKNRVLLSALAYYRDVLVLDPDQKEAREAVDALTTS